MGSHHQELGLHNSLDGQRHVNGHLVSVEVGIVRGTNERVHSNGITFDQNGLESLNGQTVKSRGTV